MLKAFKAFLESALSRRDGQDENDGGREHALRVATAALLVEMSRADHERASEERETILRLLQENFALDAAEAAGLLVKASDEAEESVSLYEFTHLLHEHFAEEDKRRLIEMLWEVAYSDGRLDKYEEYLVRRVADLLYVPHGDLIRLKHVVLERLSSG